MTNFTINSNKYLRFQVQQWHHMEKRKWIRVAEIKSNASAKLILNSEQKIRESNQSFKVGFVTTGEY